MSLLILQSSDGAFWSVSFNNAGIINATQVNAGPATAVVLQAPNGTPYQITIAPGGVSLDLVASTMAGMPSFVMPSSDNGTMLQFQISEVGGAFELEVIPLTSTTIALERGHNTSADSAYNQSRFTPGMFNGTPGNPNVTIDPTKTDDSQNPVTPGHMSSQPVSLMTPGWTSTPRSIHVVPWWGSTAHPNIGSPNFRSSAYIDAFLNEIFTTAAFDYIIYDWYGQGSYEDGSVLAINARATATSFSAYKYLNMIDKGAIKTTGAQATADLIAAISYCNTHYFGDSRYITVGGRPVLMLFGVSQISGIDMQAAKTAAASLGNPLFIDEGTSVFTSTWGDGGYAWVPPYNPPNGDPINPADPYHLKYLDEFVSAANAHPTKYLWLSAWAGFDGTCTRTSSWSLGKILQRDGGICWIKSWAYTLAKANSLTNRSQLQGWQVPTYDDWQEGSEIESGIENWATVTASVTGTTLNWAASFGVSGPSQTVLGDLTTVKQWKLWVSTDNVNISLVENLPTGVTSYDLTTLPGLTPGTTYYFYVEAEGMPCVRSHMNATAAVWNYVSAPVILTVALPAAVQLQPYSQTLQASGGVLPYRWSIVSGALPLGLSLNATTGVISGTPTTSGIAEFTVKVTDADNQSANQLLQIVVQTGIQPLQITTADPLVAGNVGVGYSVTMQAVGGLSPYTWDLESGSSLPPGLSLNASTGKISGIPTTAGTYNFVIGVTDTQPVHVTHAYALTINATTPPLVITTLLMLNGAVGQVYSQSLGATGGQNPYQWSIISGSLPSGLSMDAAGNITGTPTGYGVSDFTVEVQDSSSPPLTATQALSITVIQSQLTIISPPVLPGGTLNTPYSILLQAAGGVPPYSFTLLAGDLPDGLSLSDTGIINGTPTEIE